MLNRNSIALGLALCILLFSVTSCVVQPSHETSPETRIPQRAPVELAALHESDLGPGWERSKHYEWPEERQVTEYFIKIPLQESPSWRMEEEVVCEIKVYPSTEDAFNDRMLARLREGEAGAEVLHLPFWDEAYAGYGSSIWLRKSNILVLLGYHRRHLNKEYMAYQYEVLTEWEEKKAIKFLCSLVEVIQHGIEQNPEYLAETTY